VCKKPIEFYAGRSCSYCGGKSDGEEVFYHINCIEPNCTDKDCSHKKCWNKHLPAETELASDHEMVHPLAQLFVKAVTHSESNPVRLRELHSQNETARWFKIRRDHTGRPELFVYDRFTQLCDPTRSANKKTANQFPSFVSFIGDTSVGKSTLLRAMLLMGKVHSSGVLQSEECDPDEARTEELLQILEDEKYGPVTRSGNIDHLTDPTTLGVHLYRDDGINVHRRSVGDLLDAEGQAQYPILFADCEGFGAGQGITNAERMESDSSESRGRQSLSPPVVRSRSTSRQRNLISQLPVTASCYGSQGKDGVDLFYARFLYAVSDVIVFVTKDDQRIQVELTRVLEWASAAVHRSVNHPSRKTLIIVRNMPNFHDRTFYTKENLEEKYLQGHSKLWEASPTLQEFVNKYNADEERFDRRINSNNRLYDVLFQKITCCYIPHEMRVKGKGSNELFDQYAALRKQIELASRDGQSLRASSFMQYSVPSLTHILSKAFEHFRTAEKPFDFYTAARMDNPNPKSMPDHVANLLSHALDLHAEDEEIDTMLYDTVSVCLVIYTFRRFQDGTYAPEKERKNLIG
jgi:hypothetical protein